ncbi:GPP34 family phosphoprotein [Streptomyces sp. ITFR-6]|uniref:GOLPH3/VPS74 family protein n=1 Tax=Streptomyces sp. ITFR-6 TaxID=3075197 RepID=UPI00288B9710|nr:GPP34 family phosphoprotein [Streptomyces sp. ITFR-6]WNI29931.1 GPP34 family phosphoprotein [Streptomyces sp. ITFR-6]
MIPEPTPTRPEELLLPLYPVRGKPFCRNRFLEYAMAGAALAELELQDRVTGQGARFQVTHPLEPPDPVLAGVTRSLPAPGKGGGGSGASAERWVRHAGRRVEGLYLDALVERGVLRRETHRFLGLLPYRRHPVVAKDLAALARTRFYAAERAGFPDPRSRALAALVSAAGLSRSVGGTDRGSRRAMRHLVHDHWPAHAVLRNIRQDKANQSGDGG